MTKAAFLSAGGDVFIADFVLSLWNKYWRDEIDVMYIAYNNHAEVPLETSKEFVRKWGNDPKVRIIYTPMGIGNGNPITQMMLNSKEDLVLLLEDDGFIFTPGIVDSWFRRVENGDGDMVGSQRYTVGEIADAAQRKYNLQYEGLGDHGFGMWPNFFVCRREDLLKTDWDFGSTKYSQGTYIKEIDHTMEKDEYTDTFTFASLQLRHMGLRLYEIPQNHTHPEDIDFQRTHEVMFANEDPKYIHGGSLSSGWGGYLNKTLPSVETSMQKMDIETRVAMWSIACGCTKGFQEFKIQYQDAIRKLIDSCNLDENRITKKIQLYGSLMHL